MRVDYEKGFENVIFSFQDLIFFSSKLVISHNRMLFNAIAIANALRLQKKLQWFLMSL